MSRSFSHRAGHRFPTCIHLAFSLFLFLALSGGYAASSQNGPDRKERFEAVAPGVEHTRLERGHKSDDAATGPWVINLLRIEPSKAELRLVHALDEVVGLETVSSMAARYGAIAAINAGFFRTVGTYRGDPSGVLVLKGKLLSEPLPGRAVAALVERGGKTEVFFSYLRFTGSLQSSRGTPLTVNGINRERGANELIIYTPEFHRTTLTTPDGIEFIVRRSRIVERLDGRGSSRIPDDGHIISASGTARELALKSLRVGSRVKLSLSLIERIADSPAVRVGGDIVGGGPSLITNGRISIDPELEGVDPRFVSDRHPRTAVAILGDGRVLLATVDGRQTGVSVGMSLPALASLLLEFGATAAINLDGGGSTTMVVKGKLVNNPSDQTGERPVSDAILIVPRRAKKL